MALELKEVKTSDRIPLDHSMSSRRNRGKGTSKSEKKELNRNNKKVKERPRKLSTHITKPKMGRSTISIMEIRKTSLKSSLESNRKLLKRRRTNNDSRAGARTIKTTTLMSTSRIRRITRSRTLSSGRTSRVKGTSGGMTNSRLPLRDGPSRELKMTL